MLAKGGAYLGVGVVGLPSLPGKPPGEVHCTGGPPGVCSVLPSRALAGVSRHSCASYTQPSGGRCLQAERKLHGPGRVGVPWRPADLGVAFCQASVGAWFPHKAIMFWEN